MPEPIRTENIAADAITAATIAANTITPGVIHANRIVWPGGGDK